MRDKLKNNSHSEPTMYLAKKMWKFSAGNRFMVVVYLIMSSIAQLSALLEPIVFALLINEVQRN